ncbi:unnamed protein product [Strongylus vulgaris]|uniref:CLIP1 zinc knuckle domain-containing protein n=1 Tax=Strongylus vulgaris TaxID=40348 RepID=A0A3P7J6F2_STRVU|nr:unnamed protein product [Strongylus vulgaris]
MRSDFENAMQKIRRLTEEKAAEDEELHRLQQEVSQKQNELVSLRIKEANSTAQYDDAKKKISSSIIERWFCEHCDDFTEHTTENCPHYVEVKPEVQEITSASNSDEYCEFCSENGHDTFSCPFYKLRAKQTKSVKS